MSIDIIKSALPAYAKDIKLNLDSVLSESGSAGLNNKQISAIALACAQAARYKPLTDAIYTFAAQHLSAEELAGASAANSMMGMTNIYYRFTHLVENTEYRTLPARLRMNIMQNPGLDKVDFELASLAVSAINGCGMCLDSHEKNLRGHNLTAQAVQSTIRIAAVIHAAAVTLEQQAV